MEIKACKPRGIIRNADIRVYTEPFTFALYFSDDILICLSIALRLVCQVQRGSGRAGSRSGPICHFPFRCKALPIGRPPRIARERFDHIWNCGDGALNGSQIRISGADIVAPLDSLEAAGIKAEIPGMAR